MWSKLIKQWPGKAYQTKNKRVRERMDYFKKIAPDFKDKDILEFGCNAGLFCLPLAKYAKSYTGIEKAHKYYKQALVTGKHLPDTFKFMNISAEEFLKEEHRFKYDALILSRVLYYFSEDVVEQIVERVLPRCDIVTIICGLKSKKECPNNYKFWKPSSCMEFLKDFDCEFKYDSEKAFFMIQGKR